MTCFNKDNYFFESTYDLDRARVVIWWRACSQGLGLICKARPRGSSHLVVRINSTAAMTPKMLVYVACTKVPMIQTDRGGGGGGGGMHYDIARNGQ